MDTESHGCFLEEQIQEFQTFFVIWKYFRQWKQNNIRVPSMCFVRYPLMNGYKADTIEWPTSVLIGDPVISKPTPLVPLLIRYHDPTRWG